jgi:YHS domain-containing protein
MMLAGAAAVSAAIEGDKKAVTNKNCPVSGGGVVEKFRTEYKGQYVYLCCQGCVDEFNKTPEAFVAKLPKEDQEAIKMNTSCPVSKEPIDNAKWVEDEGRKVYFCCDGCVAKYKKDHPTAKSN